MDTLKAQIKRFLDEENELLDEEREILNRIYSRFLEDHAYLWTDEEIEDLAKLRHILLVIIKLFYQEHRILKDVRAIDQQEFNKAVRDLIANPDALLQRLRKSQIKEIEMLKPEGWFNAFRKDIEKINEAINCRS